tara:strand:+ start:1222 stop:2199 length:978 start_codon:yes stop_codon:yes gene_type:complete
MKAIRYNDYGAPDVLRYQEIEKPIPEDKEILIKVKSASVNPLDWHMMRGRPLFMRVSTGLSKPKHNGLGADVSGVVESVGAGVTKFSPGDEVFGDVFETGLGSLAEFAKTREDKLVLKPKELSFDEAAAVPVAAITALQGLRDTGRIQSGQSVLVNGASGGVGSFAVQIAKSFGAQVTGVCSTRNLKLIESIGADHAIDYTKEDFANKEDKYDLIFDAVGNRSVPDLAKALKLNGRCVIAGFTNMSRLMHHIFRGAWESKTSSKWVGLMPTAHMEQKDLEFLADLLAANKVHSVIDRVYPLEKAAEAIEYLETGHARGKVVIQIS